MNTQDHKQALPPGFRLGSYRVVRVLGAGGFGVTYLCEHGGLGVTVAVKEYLPNDIAVRSGRAVVPKSAADREGYRWGLSRFLDEARTLARFEHRNVVRVRDYFEANGTAYIVMDYEDGEPLDRVLERKGTLTEAQIKRVLLPIVAGLRQMHAAGFLHRDVKPANIFIRRSDESPVLLDFGSARQALGRLSRSVTAIASSGYSPPEQYESNGGQGPWTDIYALSALCYRAVTGSVPVEATRRQGQLLRGEGDPLPRLAAIADGRCSQAFLATVDRGLQVVGTERPQSLAAWLTELEGPVRKPVDRPDADPPLREAEEPGDASARLQHPKPRLDNLPDDRRRPVGVRKVPSCRPRTLPTFPRWTGGIILIAGAVGGYLDGFSGVIGGVIVGVLLTSWAWRDNNEGAGAADNPFEPSPLRRAAEQGDAAAQNDLGVMYASGEEVEWDDRLAVLWFHRAAKQGFAQAEYNLGLMCRRGWGVAHDNEQAALWYRRAAEQGHAEAQADLGWMYVTGLGVSEDVVQGHAWLNLAAQALSRPQKEGYAGTDDRSLRTDRWIAERGMTPSQIAEAQNLSRELAAAIAARNRRK